MPMCWAWESASLTTNPSAMRMDETRFWYWQLSDVINGGEESKIQARPATEVFFFQFASVLHVTVPTGINWGLTGIRVFFGVATWGSWACVHSIAPARVFVAVVCTNARRALKKSLFLAIHKFQHTHEKRSPGIPHGARQIEEDMSATAKVKEENMSGLNSEVRGIKLQTCLAKEQWRRMCSVVSVRPQCPQVVFCSIPLFWRLYPVGSAPWIAFHRNSCSFGAVEIDHTDMYQLKESR